MKDARTPLNVGISIALREGTSIWSSGLNQNLAFLVTLLRHVPGVGKVYLLNPSGMEALPSSLAFDTVDAKLVRPDEVTHDLGLVIEMGASLPVEWLRHVRALGTRIVTFFVGNTYVSQAEAPMFGRESGATFTGTPWHEIWTLPQYERSCIPLFKTVGRVPVHAMPHIWSPVFVDRESKALAARGLEFGFVPGKARRPWRAAMFEPNTSVTKTCFIPMLVCEHAYRTDRESLEYMMVANSLHMKEHLTFNRFAAHLDLTRDGKASYEPRLPFAECMAANRMDVVVSHQTENEQNYLYYDALHGGYPLVHNSDALHRHGMGFHYPGFEATRGGACLLDAWSKPPEFWQHYRSASAAWLRTLAPDNPSNVQAFAARITALLQ
jgi:hypothetical protein